MNKGITTSIRLTPQLRQQIDCLAHSLHKGKNWIITQAIQEYVKRSNYNDLVVEAQRQSLLAGTIVDQEEVWQNNIDTTGWQN